MDFVEKLLKDILSPALLHEVIEIGGVISKRFQQEGIDSSALSIMNDGNFAGYYFGLQALIAHEINVDLFLIPNTFKAEWHDPKNVIKGLGSDCMKFPLKTCSLRDFLKRDYKLKGDFMNRGDFFVKFDLLEFTLHPWLQNNLIEQGKEKIKSASSYWNDIFKLAPDKMNRFKLFELLHAIEEVLLKISKRLNDGKQNNASLQFQENGISNAAQYLFRIKELFSNLNEINSQEPLVTRARIMDVASRFHSLISTPLFVTPAQPISSQVMTSIPTSKESISCRTIPKNFWKEENNRLELGSLLGQVNLKNLISRFLLIYYQFHESELESIYEKFISFIKELQDDTSFIENFNLDDFKKILCDLNGKSLIFLPDHGIYYSLVLERVISLVNAYHDEFSESIQVPEIATILNIPQNHLQVLLASLIQNGHYIKQQGEYWGSFQLFFDEIKVLNQSRANLNDEAKNIKSLNLLKSRAIPYWYFRKGPVIDWCSPSAWIETPSETPMDSSILSLRQEAEKPRFKSLYEVELGGQKLSTTVDTGAFKSLLSQSLAEKLFPKAKRSKVLISGITQNAQWMEIIKGIPFTFKGQAFHDDFLVYDSVESIFKAEVVLGHDAYNQLLERFFGKTLKTLFDDDGAKWFRSLENARREEHTQININNNLSDSITSLISDDLDASKMNESIFEDKASTALPIQSSDQADESRETNQLLTTLAGSHLPSAIITRKFALIPEGNKLARSNTINNIREQFIKFRDLENIYSKFLVDLVKSDPSIVNNQPWEYPNFHLSITRAHRTQFNDLKARGILSPDEKLPTDGKARIRKYFYDHFSDPSNPLRNLSRFNTNYRKKVQFIERANQNAIQYPFYSVRNWIVRNERLKTITGTLIELLNSQQHQKIRYRKQGIDKIVPSSSYMIGHFLGGKPLHREFLKQFSDDTKHDIFGQFDNPSHEYISGHVGQLRNIVLNKGTLETSVRTSISRVINQITKNPTMSDVLLEGMLKKYPNIQQHFLKRYVRLARFRTTKLAKLRLKKGIPLNGNSIDIVFVNELFDTHDMQDLTHFKAMRNSLISEESIMQSKGYKELSLGEIKAKVLDKTIQFLQSILVNPSLNASKAIFKPSYPRIGLTSLDHDGLIDYLSTKLFLEVKSRFHSLFMLHGEADKIKKQLIDELRNIKNAIYDMTAPPKFKKLSIPLVQPEYMYELDGVTQTAKFGMIKKQGKEHSLHLSPNQRERFNNVYEPNFELNDRTQQYKDNLSNPVLKMEGRKLILCQPFKIKMDNATNTSQRESTPKIEVGVDLGIKHFAVLSVMDKTDPTHPIELQRYFLGQKTLYDMKFDDQSGHFKRLTNQKHATNIKLKLINLRQEHDNIQRKRAEYENRHPSVFHKKIKHYHRSKTESVLWNKIQHLNSDIVARLSGLIVKIAKYHGAQFIRFEDLRWSRHQAKKEKGKFIAFWQVHWFHSQVLSMTAQNAIRCGIRAVMVDAFMSSQTCASCHEKGDRLKSNTKLFYCPHCKTTLDADLNAARNITKRDTVKILPVSLSPEYLCSVDGFQ
ncbi:MAG: zinc ribbon domain-containing protein [Promethearchaeota archaeon]